MGRQHRQSKAFDAALALARKRERQAKEEAKQKEEDELRRQGAEEFRARVLAALEKKRREMFKRGDSLRQRNELVAAQGFFSMEAACIECMSVVNVLPLEEDK